MAGYSGTPLWRKLGLRANARVALVREPRGFWPSLGDAPEGLERVRVSPNARIDVAVLFANSSSELERGFAPLQAALTDAGGLWIAWPKKSSGVATDLTDGVVRAFGLARGLVDNKVCAIDDTWSGLRFVRRLADRETSGKMRSRAAKPKRARAVSSAASKSNRKAAGS